MNLTLAGLTEEQKYEAAGKFAGVPAQLFKGMWEVESAKGTQMTSRAGARGHFQTMPKTQVTFEQRAGRKFDPDNFDDSLTMAAMAIQENLRKFKTIPDALRAYNSGWDTSKWGNTETSEYVGKIYKAGGMESAGAMTMLENAAPGSLVEQAADGSNADLKLLEMAYRGDDLGDLGRGSLRERLAKTYLSDVEKGVINQAGVDTAAAGVGRSDAIALGVTARAQTAENVDANVQSFVAQRGGSVADVTTSVGASSAAKASMEAAFAREKRAQELTVNEKWGSHFQTSLSAGLLRKLENDIGDAYPEGYDYASRAAEIEKDKTYREKEMLRESVNLQDEARIQDLIREQRYAAEIQGHMSGSSNLLWGIGAGVSDPAGWAAGFGVGKVAQVAGVGARAYAAAGRPLAAAISAGLEGSVGNVLSRATLDVMGDYAGAGDYVMDAAVGLGLGAVMSAPGIIKDTRLLALQREMDQHGAQTSFDIALKAQELAGPDATPEQIRKAIDSVVEAEDQSWRLAELGNVNNQDRLFARADVGTEPDVAVVTRVTDDRPATLFRGTGDDAGTGTFYSTSRAYAESYGKNVEEIVGIKPGSKEIDLSDTLHATLADTVDSEKLYFKLLDVYKLDDEAVDRVMSTIGRGGDAEGNVPLRSVMHEPTIAALKAEGIDVVRIRQGDGETLAFANQEAKDLRAAPVESSTGGTNYSIFNNDGERNAFIEAHDLHNSIPNDDMRAMVAEVIARSKQINDRIDLSPERLKTFLQKFDLEATSTTMLNSKSDVSRAVAAMLMENPEGAAGRRSTASVQRSASFEMYMGNVMRNSDQLYSLWAKEQGFSHAGSAIDTKLRARFNRDVQLEMDRRWNGRPEGQQHPLVKRAADMYDEGYKIMGRDQKFVGTLGSDAIDLNTKGYFQRSWNLNVIRELSQNTSKRNAFLNAMEDQFRTVAGFTDSAEFNVRALAIQYLSRLEHRATGKIDVPANLYAQDAGVIIKDALHSLGLSEDEVASQLKKFTRGASGHTKNRIDMDYSKEYDDGAGNKFMMIDFLDQDMNGLYRRYAGRTAGDVALAKYGIMGQNGLDVLHEAMAKTGASKPELRAFEQWSAEMTGKPFGSGDPLLAQNARMLTNLTRMGGAVFPQMGMFVDAVAGLGVTRAFKLMGNMNQMRKEVQALARGEKVNNSILGGFEGIGPEFGTAEYRISGLFDTGEIEVDIATGETAGRITKAIRAGSHVQRILSGHRWVTAAQTRGAAEQVVRKALRFVREGGEDISLRDMGIDESMEKALKSRLSKIAKFDKSGELMSFDPMKLDADDLDGKRAIFAFRDAVLRGTNQIMNKEFPGETGKWAHNGWLKMLLQFRTFSMVAQQKQFNRLLHTQGAAKLVGLMIGGMAVAAPIHMARVAMKASLMEERDRGEYIEKNMHPLALGRATMNYLSSVGLWADVVEAGSGLGAGWADAFNIDLPDYLRPTGGRMMRDTDMIGGQFAPALGVINDIGQGVMGKTDKLYKTAPFASLPYIQPLIMGMDSQFGDD